MDIRGSAVVTGASRGIGRAVALELARRGFDTLATMRDPDAGAAMAAEADGRLRVRRLDVTDPSTFDLPDDLRVLVNNAGIDTDYLPVEHANIDDWRRMFETNVFGVVALTAAAIPILRGESAVGDLHRHLLLDHRGRSLLLRLPGVEGGRVRVR